MPTLAVLQREETTAAHLPELREEGRMKIPELTDQELSRWIADKLDPQRVPGKGVWYVAMYETVKHHDMVNDPAMTVMLFGKLEPSAIVSHISSGYNVQFRNGREPGWTGERPTLGRAVAEAFALAHAAGDPV